MPLQGVTCSDSEPLAVGTVLDVSNPSYPGCTTPYSLTKADTSCSEVAARLGLLPGAIAAANPGLNCDKLVPDLLVRCLLCAPRGAELPS